MVQKGSSNDGKVVAFKYYIHDTSAGYTLAMHGPFTESSVSELNCCWATAKTTLGDRMLMLDFRGLTFIDDTARQWVAGMVQEGARCLPEAFLREAVAGQLKPEANEALKVGLFDRISNSLGIGALKPTR